MITVNSTELRNNYEVVLNEVCTQLWNGLIEASKMIQTEDMIPVSINVGDLCNTLTNLAQAYRRDNQ